SSPEQLDPITIEYDSGAPVFGIDLAQARLLKLGCDKFPMAHILDSQMAAILYNLNYVNCNGLLAHAGLPEKTLQIVVAEDPLHLLLATYNDYEAGVSIWKLNGDTYEPLLKLNTQGLTLEFTDHNERLRARNFNGWKIYSVADILAAATKPHE
ncbi:MAG: hypothetical protein H0X30_38585, partial [Anaerolineae bacterium]|nr:hypothetical protein [Anaerolineae bacterium]